MGARRRWTATALLLLAAQAVVVLWLELAFGLNSLVRQGLVHGASVAGDAIAVLIPTGIGRSLDILATFLGFGWVFQHFLLPAFSGTPGAGVPSLGGALVAPVYFAVRRAFLVRKTGDRESPLEGPGSLRSRMAKALEALRPPSTSVQESL